MNLPVPASVTRAAALIDPAALALYDMVTQAHVRLQVALCEEIAGSPLGVVAAAGQVANRFAGQRGMSRTAILTRYYAFRETGDWRIFIHKAKQRTKAPTLPAAFVDYWCALAQGNRRKSRPAWRQLVSQWRGGREIPGYGTWRDYWMKQGMNLEGVKSCPDDLPPGWSYSSLMRVKPDRADLQLARYGIAATRHMLPHVVGTREGMRPLEYLAFDDVELDFLVVVPGVERPCKLRALVVKDVATDCWLRFVLRPALVREDGTQDGLKLRDMKRLCLETLQNFGYPVDYVSHWIVERGTATLPAADIAALAELSAGMIQVHQTSMVSGKVLLGGFADKAVGNSWGKAWIESGFNRLHNELAVVKGQKGRRYDLAPAELENRKKEAIELIRASRALPPDLRLLVRLPFLDIYQATDQLRDALLRINVDRDHQCEGFEDVVEWRLHEGDPWKPYYQLLELPTEIMDHVMTNRRIETRMERWARLVQGVTLRKLADEVAPRWMDDHRTVRVEKYQIQFKHEGKTLVYFDRDSALLREGEEYLAYFNPFDLDHIYLTNAEGAYRGKLPRVKAVTRGDQEALERRLADTQHVLKSAIARVRSRSTSEAEQAIAEAEQNLILFQDTGSVAVVEQLNQAVAETAGDKARAADRRSAGKKLNAADLLGDAPQPEYEPRPDNVLDPSTLL